MARGKTSKQIAEELRNLQAEAKKAERAEFEEFGRWAVAQLVASRRGSATDRIEEARELIEGLAGAKDKQQPAKEVADEETADLGSWDEAGSTSDEQVNAARFS